MFVVESAERGRARRRGAHLLNQLDDPGLELEQLVLLAAEDRAGKVGALRGKVNGFLIGLANDMGHELGNARLAQSVAPLLAVVVHKLGKILFEAVPVVLLRHALAWRVWAAEQVGVKCALLALGLNVIAFVVVVIVAACNCSSRLANAASVVLGLGVIIVVGFVHEIGKVRCVISRVCVRPAVVAAAPARNTDARNALGRGHG